MGQLLMARRAIILAGAVCLVSAAVLWLALVKDGFTLQGAFMPSLFTILGVFWVALGLRGEGPEESGDQDSVIDE